MLKELIKLANELDERGLQKEADTLDKMIKSAVGPGMDGFSSQMRMDQEKRKREKMKPKEEPSLMDVAVGEEANLKRQREQDESDAQKKEIMGWLQETAKWFQDNIFVSKVDKFPVATDKDYMYSDPRSNSTKKGYIVPAGTVFEDLDGHGTLRDGSSPFTHSLRTIYQYATGVLKRLNEPSQLVN